MQSSLLQVLSKIPNKYLPEFNVNTDAPHSLLSVLICFRPCCRDVSFQAQRPPQVPLSLVLYLLLWLLQGRTLPYRIRLRRLEGAPGKAQVHLLWGRCGGTRTRTRCSSLSCFLFSNFIPSVAVKSYVGGTVRNFGLIFVKHLVFGWYYNVSYKVPTAFKYVFGYMCEFCAFLFHMIPLLWLPLGNF